MKKIISTILSLSFVLFVTCMSVPVLAGEDNEQTLDKEHPTGQVALSASVSPTFLVTIPTTVEMGKTVTLSATDVLTEANKAVQVAITGTDQDQNAFRISTTDGASIPYQITRADNQVLGLNEVMVFEYDASEALTFDYDKSITQLYAGDYRATLTFQVKYADIPKN